MINVFAKLTLENSFVFCNSIFLFPPIPLFHDSSKERIASVKLELSRQFNSPFLLVSLLIKLRSEMMIFSGRSYFFHSMLFRSVWIIWAFHRQETRGNTRLQLQFCVSKNYRSPSFRTTFSYFGLLFCYFVPVQTYKRPFVHIAEMVWTAELLHDKNRRCELSCVSWHSRDEAEKKQKWGSYGLF